MKIALLFIIPSLSLLISCDNSTLEKEIPKLLLENAQVEVEEIDHVGVY